MSWPDRVEYTHRLPEWLEKETTSSRKRIHLRDIARALGYSESEGKRIEELDAESGRFTQMLRAMMPKPIHA